MDPTRFRNAILAAATVLAVVTATGLGAPWSSSASAQCTCGPPPARGGGPATGWTPSRPNIPRGPAMVPRMGPIRPPIINPGVRAAQDAATSARQQAVQTANRRNAPPEDEGELPVSPPEDEGEPPEPDTAGTEESAPPTGPVVTTEVDANGNVVTVITLPDGTVIREVTTTVTTNDFTSTEISQTTTYADGSHTASTVTTRTNNDNSMTLTRRTTSRSGITGAIPVTLTEWVFSDDNYSAARVDNSNDLYWASLYDSGENLARGVRNTAVIVGGLIALSPAVAASAVAGTTIFGVSVGGTTLSGVATIGVISGGIASTQAAADTYMDNANATWSELAANALHSGVLAAATGAASATVIAGRVVGATAELVGDLAALGNVTASAGILGLPARFVTRAVAETSYLVAGSNTLTGIATNAVAAGVNYFFDADPISPAPAPASAPVPRR